MCQVLQREANICARGDCSSRAAKMEYSGHQKLHPRQRIDGRPISRAAVTKGQALARRKLTVACLVYSVGAAVLVIKSQQETTPKKD